jgi:hypothetical protein
MMTNGSDTEQDGDQGETRVKIGKIDESREDAGQKAHELAEQKITNKEKIPDPPDD